MSGITVICIFTHCCAAISVGHTGTVPGVQTMAWNTTVTAMWVGAHDKVRLCQSVVDPFVLWAEEWQAR